MLCSNRRSLYTWFDWLCFEKIEWLTWLSSFDTSERNNYTRQSEEASVWFHSTLEWFWLQWDNNPPTSQKSILPGNRHKKEEKNRKETITRLIFVGSKARLACMQPCLLWPALQYCRMNTKRLVANMQTHLEQIFWFWREKTSKCDSTGESKLHPINSKCLKRWHFLSTNGDLKFTADSNERGKETAALGKSCRHKALI